MLRLHSALAVLLALPFLGCASDYVARTHDFRRAYETGNYPRAVELIAREEKDENSIDRLLVLLDKGMVLHAAGRYEESIKVLAEADKLSQQIDFTSISEEAGTLLTNERQRTYRGEDFEKLMISTLQALNYAGLGKDEDALVEVRRVNERIRKMIAEEKKPYEQLAIARYLGGVLYEDVGEEDSAFIDYNLAHQLQPQLGSLAEPLVRLAKKTGREDAYDKLRKLYPDVSDEPLGPNEGQIVVIVEAGRAPVKEESNAEQRHHGAVQLVAVPRFRDRGVPPRARASLGAQEAEAVTVTSISKVAKVHLNDRIGRILARSVASTAIKAGVAAGVGAATNSEALGVLTFLLLSSTNQSDLRSWLSLPAEFQVARLRAPAGQHELTLRFAGHATTHPVTVKPKRIALVVVRRY